MTEQNKNEFADALANLNEVLDQDETDPPLKGKESEVLLERETVSTIRLALFRAADPNFAYVPVKITKEMQEAYFHVIDYNHDRVNTDPLFGRYRNNEEAYKAMITAATDQASQGGEND